ncbi:hypothetical protein D3C76_1774780 [compost metagenome]
MAFAVLTRRGVSGAWPTVGVNVPPDAIWVWKTYDAASVMLFSDTGVCTVLKVPPSVPCAAL